MTGPTKADHAPRARGEVGTTNSSAVDSTTVKQRRETVARRVKALIDRTAAAGWIPAGLAHELLGLLRLRRA